MALTEIVRRCGHSTCGPTTGVAAK